MSIINQIGSNISEFLKDVRKLSTSLYFWLGLALFLILNFFDRVCSIPIQLIKPSSILSVQIFFSVVTIGAYILVFKSAYKLYRSIQKRHHIHINSFNIKKIIAIIKKHLISIISWLVIIFISNAVFSMIAYKASKDSYSVENQNTIINMLKSSPISTITTGIMAIIFAPIIEELLNRGIFYNLFNFSHLNIITKVLVVVLDGTIFSSGHMTTNFAQFLIYFMAGVILSLCYLTNHSLTCSITLHASNNLFCIICLL